MTSLRLWWSRRGRILARGAILTTGGFLLATTAHRMILDSSNPSAAIACAVGAGGLIVAGLELTYRRLDEVERSMHDLAFRWAYSVTVMAALLSEVAGAARTLVPVPLWSVAIAAWLVAFASAWLRYR